MHLNLGNFHLFILVTFAFVCLFVSQMKKKNEKIRNTCAKLAPHFGTPQLYEGAVKSFVSSMIGKLFSKHFFFFAKIN